MNKNLDTIRHSLAHILAAAVYQMFPEAKFGIGPVIENGFYYDFELPRTLIPEDLEIIEGKMCQIIKKDIKFEAKEVKVAKAKKFFAEAKQPYKVELIEGIENRKQKTENSNQVTIYKTGDFVDLCSGPHVESTKELPADSFRLTAIAGAYWRGNENNAMLQRIYGVAFETKKELDNYLKLQKEAKKRDHKKLGRSLDLYFFDESAPGMAYFLPKGTILYNTILEFWREEHEKLGYQEIKSPLLNKQELYEISGHWDHYRDDMFMAKTKEKEVYGLKPMNCPNAMIVFASAKRSYKELPLRLSDCDVLHRCERSGTLNGLFRVREFAQDDAHIFVRENQIEEEYQRIFEIVERFYSVFGLEYTYRLGTRPEKFMGDKKTWDKAEKILENLLEKTKKKFHLEKGEGAFYGPKIDILMKDSLEREWQMGTIQLDFQIPLNFKLKFTDEKGREETPVVIHRVVYGSLERFIGILVEHYAGLFPLWVAPEQVRILPISDKFNDYAQGIVEKLKSAEIRAKLDNSNESLGKKIRNAELEKVPYMFIVGEKEKKAGTVSVRHHAKGDLGSKKLEEILKILASEIKEKEIKHE